MCVFLYLFKQKDRDLFRYPDWQKEESSQALCLQDVKKYLDWSCIYLDRSE